MDDPLEVDDSLTFVHENVLRQVIEGQETVASPYSQFGTLVAKARTLFPFLVDIARERRCTDHGAIASECGIHAARQGSLLSILGRHEAALGRPLLPAVVTKAGQQMPGEAYFELVAQVPDRTEDVPSTPAERRWLWETQREAVYRCWSPSAVRERRADQTVTIP